MNLNQLINEMSDKELALPFSIYVEVPRYIRELEDFELSADSVEDFFDSYVTDDYLLRATAYIDYERVVVYLDINDLEVTQNGYDKEYGEYCVATRFQGELLNSYGELFSESVKSNKKLRLREEVDSEMENLYQKAQTKYMIRAERTQARRFVSYLCKNYNGVLEDYIAKYKGTTEVFIVNVSGTKYEITISDYENDTYIRKL